MSLKWFEGGKFCKVSGGFRQGRFLQLSSNTILAVIAWMIGAVEKLQCVDSKQYVVVAAQGVLV